MKLNKKLMFSVLTLVLAISLATASTFAWFTMNTKVSVDQIDLTVTTKDGISISTTGEAGSYSNKVTLTGFDAIGLQPLTLENNTVTSGAVSLVDDSNAAAATDTYYKFDLYFQSAEEYDIKIDSTTEVTGTIPEGKEFKVVSPISVGTVKEGDLISSKVENAARLAFANTSSAVFYDPHAGEGYSAAEFTKNMANEYYKSIIGNYPNKQTSAVTFDGEAAAQAETIVTLADADSDGTFTGKITVYIWIEGTDADCFAGIFNQTLNVNLSFSGTKAA